MLGTQHISIKIFEVGRVCKTTRVPKPPLPQANKSADSTEEGKPLFGAVCCI